MLCRVSANPARYYGFALSLHVASYVREVLLGRGSDSVVTSTKILVPVPLAERETIKAKPHCLLFYS